MSAPTKAQAAVLHILRQMSLDGRLAYLIGPGSQSYRLLVEAEAERTGESVDFLSKQLAEGLSPLRVVVDDNWV